jgi:predicted N-acetyltransferase YhbS
MSDALYTIREPKTRDLPAIATVFADNTMVMPCAGELVVDADLPQSSEQKRIARAKSSARSHALVAVNSDDVAVGLIRVLEVTDKENSDGSGAYVYPVVVYRTWRRYGVATALINAALKQFGELKLVACNPSQGFYPKAGFEPLEWNRIAAQIARDCELCPDCATCEPKPFIKKL